MEVRSLKLVHPSRFKSWFQETLLELDQYANTQGNILQIFDHGSIGKKYQVVNPFK
jgi:hypothetical protein